MALDIDPTTVDEAPPAVGEEARPASLLLEEAESAQARGDLDLAARRASLLRQREPNRSFGYQIGAAVARDEGKLDEASAIVSEGAARFPDEPWTLSERALIARARGDLALAEDLAGTLRARFPHEPAGYEIGSASARELGRIDAASAILEAARARFPAAPWLTAELAWTARARGDLEEAIGLAGEARAAFPDDAPGYYAEAAFLRACNRLEEAAAVLDAAMARFPAQPWFAAEAARLGALIENRAEASRLVGRIAAESGRLIEAARRPLFGPKVVVVLGMHRAGTSLCARLVEALGVDLGGPLFAGDFANADGYREHKEVVACHEALLALMRTQWDAAHFSADGEEAFFASAEVAAVRERLTRIVREQLSASGGAWAFKDPRAARFIPLWRAIFDELGVAPVWLLSVREPRAVAASLEKRDRLPRALGELLWLEHHLEALRHLGPQLDAVLHYERWFTPAAAGQLTALARLLEAPPEAVAAARASIKTDLRHHEPGRTAELHVAQQVHAWLLPEKPDLRLIQRQAEILSRKIAAQRAARI